MNNVSIFPPRCRFDLEPLRPCWGEKDAYFF